MSSQRSVKNDCNYRKCSKPDPVAIEVTRLKDWFVSVYKSVRDGHVKKKTEELPGNHYREIAAQHSLKRESLIKEADLLYRQRNFLEAQKASKLAQFELESFHENNRLAAMAFIEEHFRKKKKTGLLDLHFLHVEEAVVILDIWIDMHIELLRSEPKKDKQNVLVITGRGKHSEGGTARIKPAVIATLKERGIKFKGINPGCIKVSITNNRDCLTTT